jgi:hypothetical protein
MPKSKAPRKPRKLKTFVGLPSVFALTEQQQRDLMTGPHTALAAFRMGHGSLDHWDTLAGRINWGSVMSTHFPEYAVVQPEMSAALDALRAIEARGNYVTATGEELHTLAEALVIIDDMQRGTTRKDLHETLKIILELSAK